MTGLSTELNAEFMISLLHLPHRSPSIPIDVRMSNRLSGPLSGQPYPVVTSGAFRPSNP